VEILGSVLDKGLRHKDARVIDEHIDPSESLLSTVDQVPGSGHFTHVTIDQQ
jgi:hypothetical protein